MTTAFPTELHGSVGNDYLTLRSEYYGFFFSPLNLVEIFVKLEEITDFSCEENMIILFLHRVKRIFWGEPLNLNGRSLAYLMVKTHFCFECTFFHFSFPCICSCSVYSLQCQCLNFQNVYYTPHLTSLSI